MQLDLDCRILKPNRNLKTEPEQGININMMYYMMQNYLVGTYLQQDAIQTTQCSIDRDLTIRLSF